MKNLKTYAIIAGAGIIGYAIYRFYKLQIDFIKNIEYRVVKIKINKLTKMLVSIDVTMRVFNYSNIDATVKEMYLDLMINDTKVGNIQEKKDIVIKASGQSDVSFTFNINPALILTNITQIANMALALKDAKIVASGYAKLESGLLRATVPFEYKTTFKEYLNIK
jgi:LEA14-like dessication related protein